MIKELNSRLDRFMPKVLPIVHIKSIWGVLFNVVAAAALWHFMSQSESFLLVLFGFFIFCGLVLPVVYYSMDVGVNFQKWLIKKSQGDDSTEPQTRWRGQDNNKEK